MDQVDGHPPLSVVETLLGYLLTNQSINPPSEGTSERSANTDRYNDQCKECLLCWSLEQPYTVKSNVLLPQKNYTMDSGTTLET